MEEPIDLPADEIVYVQQNTGFISRAIDKLWVIFAVLAIAFAFLALLVLIAPLFDFLLNLLNLHIEFWFELNNWLYESNHGLAVLGASILLSFVFWLLMRTSIRYDRSLYLGAGCPECHEHDFLRIRRQRKDLALALIGIPVRRYACRGCTWNGIRLPDHLNPRGISHEVPRRQIPDSQIETRPTPDLVQVVDEPEEFSIMGSIVSGWWIILIIGVVTAITLQSINLLADPVFESTVTLQVNAPPPQDVPIFSQFGRGSLEQEILKTRANLADFIRESGALYRALEELPETNMRREELVDRVRVELPGSSQLLHIHVQASSPEESAALANALVDLSLTQYAELQAKPTAGTLSFLELEFAAAEERLAAAQAELGEFLTENDTGDLEILYANQYALLRSLMEKWDLAMIDLDLERIDRVDALIASRQTTVDEIQNLLPEYRRLVDRVSQARTEKNLLLTKMGESRIMENQIYAKSSYQVVSDARPPLRPQSAMNPRLILLGIVAGILAGILFVILLDYMERPRNRS